MSTFQEDIRSAINRASRENGSDTPDFILATYILRCLDVFNEAVRARENWYDRECGFGAAILAHPPQVGPKKEKGGEGDASKTRPALSAVSPQPSASEDAAAIAIAPTHEWTAIGFRGEWICQRCGVSGGQRTAPFSLCSCVIPV